MASAPLPIQVSAPRPLTIFPVQRSPTVQVVQHRASQIVHRAPSVVATERSVYDSRDFGVKVR